MVSAARTTHLDSKCLNTFISNVSIYSTEGKYVNQILAPIVVANLHRPFAPIRTADYVSQFLKVTTRQRITVEQHALKPTMQLCSPICAELPYTTRALPMIPIR